MNKTLKDKFKDYYKREGGHPCYGDLAEIAEAHFKERENNYKTLTNKINRR